jgi:hypothetical protein
MGPWIFTAVLGAAVIHIFEEYVYPAGFRRALERLIPRGAHLFTLWFHVLVNGLFLLLCLGSVLIGTANLVLSLSVFSLVFINGVLHIRGSFVTRAYYPGVISGTLLYIPLTVYAYRVFLVSGRLTWLEFIASILLGALYMGVPMGYVLLQQKKQIILNK